MMVMMMMIKNDDNDCNNNNNNNDNTDNDENDNRKCQDYVYIEIEYRSTMQKIKHYLRHENKYKRKPSMTIS